MKNKKGNKAQYIRFGSMKEIKQCIKLKIVFGSMMEIKQCIKLKILIN